MTFTWRPNYADCGGNENPAGAAGELAWLDHELTEVKRRASRHG